MVDTSTRLRRDEATKRTLGKQRGGWRPGAGRPASASIHARLTEQNLAVDARAARHELIAAIQGSEVDPLLTLLEIACDREKPDEIRVQAAAVAVRHVHPTLQQSQLHLVHQKADQGRVLELLHERLDRIAPPSLPQPAVETEPAQDALEAPAEPTEQDAA